MREFFLRLRQFKDWIQNWIIPPWETQFIEEELPQRLARKTIYIMKEDGYLWHASMLCPCGCGDILHMNLIPDEHPYWRLKEHGDGTVSLYPSVRRKKNCRCHFWFQHGQVKWCGEKQGRSYGESTSTA